MCLSCTGKRWISVLVHEWSVFQNTVTIGHVHAHVQSLNLPCNNQNRVKSRYVNNDTLEFNIAT